MIKPLASGGATPGELLEVARKTIARYNCELNAFITVFMRDVTPSYEGRLRGVTVAVKDNIYVKGHRTTAGSRILRDFVPSYDAEVVTRLKTEGAIILGKTNLHEFAFGVTNINPHFGVCRNPWKRDRVSGGSSGGSAVAVAKGMTRAGIGTDTAGSVRIPAALCGVVGYKPTHGLVSRRGVVPLAWSLDTVGFLTRSTEDAILLASLASRREELALRPNPTVLKGLRIGVPKNIIGRADKDIMRRYDEALAVAEENGARLVRFNFSHFNEASACRSLIVHAEAASFHRQYFSTKYSEYGPDLRCRIAQGLSIPAAVYLDARRARHHLLDYYRSIFKTVDLIAVPTTRIPAPTIEACTNEETAPDIRTALLALTEPFNLFGAPAISIPCGLTREGLPVGLQLAGDLNADNQLLSAALSLESQLPSTLDLIPS